MSKGQKIYVVTSGEYSDYRIRAVTTDPERAEQLRKRYFRDSYDGANIETFIDGDPESGDCSNFRPIWNIQRNVRNEWRCKIETYTNLEFQNEFELVKPRYITGPDSCIFEAKIDSPDRAHALKIAQDKFAKLMAEELGI